jgi:hypothetical protein
MVNVPIRPTAATEVLGAVRHGRRVRIVCTPDEGNSVLGSSVDEVVGGRLLSARPSAPGLSAIRACSRRFSNSSRVRPPDA